VRTTNSLEHYESIQNGSELTQDKVHTTDGLNVMLMQQKHSGIHAGEVDVMRLRDAFEAFVSLTLQICNDLVYMTWCSGLYTLRAQLLPMWCLAH
jgi:hypothetical protein